MKFKQGITKSTERTHMLKVKGIVLFDEKIISTKPAANAI